jgi:hypothetical protein
MVPVTNRNICEELATKKIIFFTERKDDLSIKEITKSSQQMIRDIRIMPCSIYIPSTASGGAFLTGA